MQHGDDDEQGTVETHTETTETTRPAEESRTVETETRPAGEPGGREEMVPDKE